MARQEFNTYHRRFVPLRERFMENVNVVSASCWLWAGKLESGGRYGVISIKSRPVRAHRASWEIFIGEIPSGKFVCHKCDVTRCVNPEHLFIGTALDNTRDMIAKGRDRRLHGSKHPTAKLTEKQVLDIRASCETGKALAKRYGVGEMTVSRVRRGLRWRHI